MKARRLVLSSAIALAALALAVPAASAHPLGNFTINHYSGLRVAAGSVVVDQVMDFAEVPTFAERRAMDADADGTVSATEVAAAALDRCAALATDLRLSVDGTRSDLRTTHTGISFPIGQGAPTMRLVCGYEASLTTPISGSATISFSDGSYAERLGWREIVAIGDGLTVAGAQTASITNRLTSYPADLLAVPLDQRSATLSVAPGGPALAPFSVPDAAPIATEEPVPAEAPAQPGAAEAPAGVTDLGADVTALFQAPELTPPIVLLSLLVAAGLGALHALSPGHGKTVMAAYLVGSNGNLRQAVGLGLTVTVSHTLGVLALGALSVSAAVVIPVERLYPILSVVSGALVIVIGGYLLVSRLRADSPRALADHGHAHGHGHGHEPERPPGWHEHDGIGHTHLPPQQGMGRRGLFALGLSGGMIPSVSALLVLIGSITIGRPEFGIVLTVAFGVGMAVVLVGIGLGLVYARGLVERFPQSRPLRLSSRLPVVTAAIVLAAGVLITGQGLASLG
jgi:ABC-type nickel/cobalt efflux system permease component RcnA